MSASTLPIVLGMLGAGLVGGLTAHFLAPTPAEAKSGASEALSPALDDVDLGPLNVQLAALTRRLDMLEAKVRSLLDELMELKTRHQI